MGPDHDAHVRFTQYLARLLDGKITGNTHEEWLAALLVLDWEEWKDEEVERELERIWKHGKPAA